MKTTTSFFLLTLISFSIIAQKNQDKMNSISKAAPSWSQNANIYEVNIRQYTPEGTFNAFAKSLPRLREMGVDILWLMPVFPIGELNRKGGLGSYYSISDYKSVNPNFGNMADLDAIIAKAHQLGMKVILDWVANHTSFDHVWTKTHPEWYNRDAQGNILVPADNDGS
jgi:glycosidase